MITLVIALVVALFVLGGLLGALAYGLTSLVGLAWRAASPTSRNERHHRPPHPAVPHPTH